MTILRAQVSINAFTNLPEHVTTNTFHFGTPVPVDGTNQAGFRDDIYTNLGAFYAAIDAYLSPVLSGLASIRIYNLSDEKPRVPWEPAGNPTITQDTSYGGQPEEFAICVSFHGGDPVTPSKRGRIYLGPLAGNVLVEGSGTAFASISPTVRTAITNACTTLAGNSVIDGCPWVVYSPKYDTAVTVTGGFVDDSPDTIRRRGHDAVDRTVWGT